MNEAAFLVGGPNDGKTIAVAENTNTVEAVFMMPLAPIIEAPRPRWWRHPVRYLRWKPPPPLPEPKIIQLRYAADGTTDDGRRVYKLVSPWQSYRGPEASRQDDGNLYKPLVDAMYAVHPAIRQDSATRWIMNLDWWKQVRHDAVSLGYGDDDDEAQPSPGDTLLGTRITVTADGGAPHLENPRFPAGWPS